MSSLALIAHQFRYDQRIFWRNPAAVFFTALLPVIFLLLLGGIFGDEVLSIRGGIKASTYYVPAIATLAIVSATLVNVAMRLVEARESGRLKRLRGTPLPAAVFVAGRIANAVVLALLMVVVVTVLGAVAFGVPVPTSTLPALVVSVLVGAFAFCSLGFALSAVIPGEDAAPPITNATVLPLYFLSGVFIPASEIPAGVLTVADVLPIRPFFEALLTCFDPATTGAGFEWSELAVVAAWGVAGLALALRYFRWAPRSR
jgi:ABC-2 type transport system permease protein